jgi:hypothetical protein
MSSRLAPFLLVLTACGAVPAPMPADSEDALASPHRYVIGLRLEEAPEDEAGTPHTRVSLVRISPEGVRTLESLGTEAGACYLEPRVGVLLAARCWWAGQGALYEVRRVGDEVVASRTEVDEMTGSGAPSEVARLAVPSGVQVRVLGPR